MAMRQQTVQRYGGFPIPAIVVRDVGEAFPVVTRDSPSRLHGRGLVVTRALQLRKMNFYAAREENLLLSRGKYFFLGREIYFPRVFKGIATDGKGTMGWCHGFKLHLACNVETINDMLKNTAQIVHSRHRSVSNFIMNLISALGAYCFFDNKPKAMQGYCIEDTKQLSLF